MLIRRDSAFIARNLGTVTRLIRFCLAIGKFSIGARSAAKCDCGYCHVALR